MLEPERTANITSFVDLKGVRFCNPFHPVADTTLFSLVNRFNMSSCSYYSPSTGEYLGCRGDEDITFVKCGFDISGVRWAFKLSIMLLTVRTLPYSP